PARGTSRHGLPFMALDTAPGRRPDRRPAATAPGDLLPIDFAGTPAAAVVTRVVGNEAVALFDRPAALTATAFRQAFEALAPRWGVGGFFNKFFSSSFFSRGDIW